MNYAPGRPAPECIACGCELTESEDLDLSGVACNSCFSESEAKMLAAKQAEAASDFRWMSREWLKKGVYLCDDCGACPDQLIEQGCGDRVCSKCEDARNETAAERQEEANNEAFYGGSAPFTSAEIWEYNEKKERGY